MKVNEEHDLGFVGVGPLVNLLLLFRGFAYLLPPRQVGPHPLATGAYSFLLGSQEHGQRRRMNDELRQWKSRARAKT